MSQTMLAGRMNFAAKSFEVTKVPVPEPGPGEVRVKVRAAGVCLSDLHLIQGLFKPGLLQGDEVTLGHEVAGEVDVLGEGVTAIAPGARVIVVAGKQLGEETWTMGVDYDGGWAEYVVAPATGLVPIPDGLPFEQAAIIPDAVSTPWAAIEWTGKVKQGESVGVWGIGGLGAHGVQLLRFAGAAPIIGIDPLPAARDRALEFGADLVLDPADPDFAVRMAKATLGAGLNVAFDFAGYPPARTQALDSLGLDGRLLLVGLSGGPITVQNDSHYQYMRKQILGHYGSQDRHIGQLVRLVELGRLDFARSISGTFGLAQAGEALEQLESKEGNPIRLVLIP